MLEKKLKSLVVKKFSGVHLFNFENSGLKSGNTNVIDSDCFNVLRESKSKYKSFSDYNIINSGVYVGNVLFPVYAALREDESVEIGPLPSFYRDYAKNKGLDSDKLPLFYLASFISDVDGLLTFSCGISNICEFTKNYSKVFDLKEF
jgi:hypothetical protein